MSAERATITEEATTTERSRITERSTTTTTEEPTTTEPSATTTMPRPTNTEATTTRAAPSTTVLPDDGDLTIAASGLSGPRPFIVHECVFACEDDAVTFRAASETGAVTGTARTLADRSG